jgi:hypothetical protein
MKILKYIFYSFLFVISFSTKAQNLSISSLIKLNEMNIAESENFLSKYKWTYVESFDKEGHTYLTFDYMENNKLIGEISKTYNNSTNFVGLSFYNRNKKNTYIQELIKLGFKKTNLFVDGERIVEEYSKGILSVSIYTRPNNNFFISVNKNN